MYTTFSIYSSQIDLIVYDFDGVMTDNKVILNEDGQESVIVNRSDGLAISLLKQAGIRQIIITSEVNKVARKRANKLNIPIINGVSNKKDVLLSFCKNNNIRLEKVIFIGNDINDFDAMKCVGFPLCPADACSEIKRISVFCLKTNGGNGVIRELIDYIII